MDAERKVFFDVFRLRRETRSFIPSGTFLYQKNYGTSLKDGECIKILTKQGMEM